MTNHLPHQYSTINKGAKLLSSPPYISKTSDAKSAKAEPFKRICVFPVLLI